MDEKTILFLGAGASRAFDFPTTKEFLDRISNDLEQFGNSKDILTGLRAIPGVLDIEHVLQILNDIIEIDNRSLLGNFFRTYVPALNIPSQRGWRWVDLQAAFRVLVDQISDAVYHYYEFDPALETKVELFYTPLFDIMTKLDHYEVPVFTTNYDKVIEAFANAKTDCVLVDGFASPRRGALPEWNPNVFKRTQKESRILVKLFKLHGSLDWRIRRSDERPVKLEQAEDRVANSRKFKENALIYPASKVAPDREPFVSLHAHFNEYTSTCSQIIAIGFAFRDEYLRQIFVSFLRRSKTNKVIIISPSAQDAAKNLLGDQKSLEKQVVRLEDSFGEPKTISDLSRAVATAFFPA